MRVATVAAALALAWGVAVAQDKQDGKKDCCGASGLICPKDGKCEGTCREICNKVGETLKAVRAKVIEKMKKECNCECPCTAGTCSAEGCESCATVKSQVFAPLFKDKVNARFKDWKKDVKHSVKGDDGKAKDVTCTFLKGDLCKACVDDLADASWKKLSELFGEKK